VTGFRCDDVGVRRLRVLVASFAMVAATAPYLLAGAGPAVAQTDDPTPPIVTLERELTECVSAAPKPGCGFEPQQAGDRGGALQIATFGLMTAGLVLIGTKVVRGLRRRDALQ
jgi:hypothetical protein